MIGVGLLLAGCAPEVTQRFEASPTATYAAFESAWGTSHKSTEEIDGKPVQVAYDVEKVEGERLTARLSIAGEEVASMQVKLTPAEGGKQTDVAGDVTIDENRFWAAVGEEGPAFTELEADLAMQMMLHDAAKTMKSQGTFGSGGPFASLGSRARAAVTDPARREAEIRRQTMAATRPMTDTEGADTSGQEIKPSVDPDRAAEQGLSGN